MSKKITIKSHNQLFRIFDPAHISPELEELWDEINSRLISNKGKSILITSTPKRKNFFTDEQLIRLYGDGTLIYKLNKEVDRLIWL